MSDISADVVVVGTGPAGYTAAIYLARGGRAPRVIEGPLPGGQLTTTTEIENYPGFPDGVSASELMERCRKQALRFGAVVHGGGVRKVDFSSSPFGLFTGTGESFRTRAVVIATGASARYLQVPGEQALIGRGVSTCATCDGFFFKDKQVVVVGGGDSALEEALFLTRFAARVRIIHRRKSLRASRIMQERVMADPKIEMVWNTVVTEIEGDLEDSGVAGLHAKNVETDQSTFLPCDGVFVAVGHEPNTAFLGKALHLDADGYIKITPGGARTSVDGIFACGDVADRRYRQAITAAGTGCRAALDVERFLSEGDQ